MAVLTALLSIILMISAAMVVDLGMQRVTRADLQALADVVALDLARELDGRDVAALDVVLPGVMAESVQRNPGVFGDQAPEMDYELGVSGVNGFEPITTGVPSAVRVHARSTVAFAFAPVVDVDSGSASRRAVADSANTACFRLGSFVAAVRSGDSTLLDPLNEIFGVNLGLVAYQGLADADVTLADLAADASLGSPEELLNSEVSYASLVQVMIDALKREDLASADSKNSAAITALTTIKNAAVTATVGAIRLGDVLHVAPSDRAAMEVDLSVLDIVGAARIADGNYFLGVPNIQAQVPGVGFQLSGGLNLIAAAQLACGTPNTAQATAETAQMSGTLHIDFTNLPTLNVAGLGTLQTPKGDADLSYVGGAGTGQLVTTSDPASAPTCGANTPADPSTMTVRVDGELASYRLVSRLSVAAEVKTTDLEALGLGGVLTALLGPVDSLAGKLALSVDLSLTIGTQDPGDPDDLSIRIPPHDTTPVSTGEASNLGGHDVVPMITSVTIGGKNVPLGDALPITNKIVANLTAPGTGFVDKSLLQLVNNIDTDYIGPLARLVGLRLAGADVYGVDVTCGLPRLIG